MVGIVEEGEHSPHLIFLNSYGWTSNNIDIRPDYRRKTNLIRVYGRIMNDATEEEGPHWASF